MDFLLDLTSEEEPLTNSIQPLIGLDNFSEISDHKLVAAKYYLATYGFVGFAYTGNSPMVTASDIDDWVIDLKGNLKIAAIHGIIKNYGVGQAPFMWKAREWTYPIFAKLWETEDLICSFDGANYQLGTGRERSTPRSWLHRDQKPQDQDFKMLQGVLNLSPNSDGNGCLVVVPESHKTIINDSSKIDWYRIPSHIDAPTLHECRSDYPTLWIWDSRLWHANKPPVRGKTRRACYVAFAPNPHKESISQKRLHMIAQGVTTSHWATKTAKNSPPRFYCATPDYVPPSKLGKVVTPEEVLHYEFK